RERGGPACSPHTRKTSAAAGAGARASAGRPAGSRVVREHPETHPFRSESEEDRLLVGAELLLQGFTDLEKGGVGASRIEHRRHDVRSVTGGTTQRLERAGHRALVASATHLSHPLPLSPLRLLPDLQQ